MKESSLSVFFRFLVEISQTIMHDPAAPTIGKSSMSTQNYYALDMVPKPLMSKLGTTTTMLLVLLKSS
jgi:hypothetical protein